MTRPSTIEEWRAHVDTTPEGLLSSRAAAVNSHAFAGMLLKEGTEMTDIEQIVRFYVLRCRKLGLAPPSGPFDPDTFRPEGTAPRPDSSSPTISGPRTRRPDSDSSTAPSTDDLDRFLLEAALD